MPAAPSLLIVPYRSKTGKLYSQIPTSGAGDFTVTRNTEARRFNSAGLIASVASGIPRLDYYTSGGTAGCPALLIEPSATNGILNSADTRTNWVCWSGFTSGAIDVIGVSGTNLTVAVSGSNIGAGAGVGNLSRSTNNVALASGSTYTISFLLKKTGSHTIGGYFATITGAGAGDLAAGFDVSGSFSSGSFFTSNFTTNRIRRVEQWGTDVFRCSETFTMSASGTLTTFRVGPVSGVTSANNPAVGAGIGFAAPQLELGSVPTSFIPTTAGTGSRSADVISVSGAVSGSIGQTEGTIYMEVDLKNKGVSISRVIYLSDGTSNNEIRISHSVTTAGDLQIAIRLAGSLVVNQTSPTAVYFGINKIAVGYKVGTNEVVMYVNGSQIILSTSSGNMPACNTIHLGSQLGTSNFLNDRIRAAALYTTRLTNAELATLTTP